MFVDEMERPKYFHTVGNIKQQNKAKQQSSGDCGKEYGNY